jgi:copper(I)-binding protein
MKILFALLCLLIPFHAYAADKLPSGLYAFETASGMKVGAVFGTFPSSWAGDELLSATSPICKTVEIHRMQDVNGMMQMRRVEFMSLTTGQDNKLDPMGYHLMLMNLSSPLQKDQKFSLTLTFKKGGARIVEIPVLSRKSK